jgi:hypothetical protein
MRLEDTKWEFFKPGKTYEHKEYIKELPLCLVVPADDNPNEMTNEEFNALGESMEKYECLQPIVVFPDYEKKMFTLVGGEHRWEVARVFDYTSIPAIVMDPEKYDESDRMELLMKFNTIHGSPSKQKFQKFVKSYIDRTGISDPDILANKMGMTNRQEFDSLVSKVSKSLPSKTMRDKFNSIKKTLRSVDDLSNIIHRLFNDHGDTVPYGYMVFDFGGKDHVWVALSSSFIPKIRDLMDRVRERGYTFDSFLLSVLLLTDLDKFIQDHEEVLERPENVE